MLNKINKLFIIIIIICFAINILLMGFLLINTAEAANEIKYTCDNIIKKDGTDNYQCPPEGQTRIQVAIPGLTSSCTYKTWKLDESGKPIDVPATCYYTESLPDFVRKLYTFSIGLIAVAAVLMIMIAGLKWIFAAGDPGKITAAKGDVIAAIVAVLLSLSSYVILNTINPRLTNLSLPGITKIEPTELVESNWCEKFEGTNHAGHTLVIVDKSNSIKNASSTECGSRYDYGYFVGTIFNKVDECNGKNKCTNGDFCVPTSGVYLCLDPSGFCNGYDKKKCDEANVAIRIDDNLNGCSFKKRTGIFDIDWTVNDACFYGPVLIPYSKLFNNSNLERVSCTDTKAEGNCWQQKDGKVISVGKKNCIDKDKTAVLGVDYMCMRYIDSDEYRAMGDDNWICKKLDTPYKCTSYKREDLCNIDYCNFGPCKWEQNKCVYK